MPRNSKQCRSNCPINFILETFGDKWTLLIVRDLMFKGKATFGEFLESEERISTNILADRLSRLEEHEIVEKAVAQDKKSKLIYTLTAKGKDLLPIMLEITAWSTKHDSQTNTPPGFLDDFKSSRQRMIAKMVKELG